MRTACAGHDSRDRARPMSTDNPPPAPPPLLRILRRKNVLSGLMFIAIAALGLWASRNYPVGTALRMSTGYVPRLLCWLLMGLGAIVLVQGLRETDRAGAARDGARRRRARAASAGRGGDARASIAFALALEPLGLVLSILLLVAHRELRDARAQALGDARRRRRPERADLGDLHRRARAADPGLAGLVTDGTAPRQSRHRIFASR